MVTTRTMNEYVECPRLSLAWFPALFGPTPAHGAWGRPRRLRCDHFESSQVIPFTQKYTPTSTPHLHNPPPTMPSTSNQRLEQIKSHLVPKQQSSEMSEQEIYGMSHRLASHGRLFLVVIVRSLTDPFDIYRSVL